MDIQVQSPHIFLHISQSHFSEPSGWLGGPCLVQWDRLTRKGARSELNIQKKGVCGCWVASKGVDVTAMGFFCLPLLLSPPSQV